MKRNFLSHMVAFAILTAVLALVVWPLHSKVLEPRRQKLLGYLQDLPDQLAGASQYALSISSGEQAQEVPGTPPLNLSDLPFKTVALVLGGFRGPLQIYMWSQAEEEKQKKIHFDLIDTHMKIALIQPDYPEVWVNLSWNLGWNVSAQWNSPEMKYKWIRHAIGFLKVGIRKNPRSVAMLAQMGDIYHHKLGQAGESVYYREWVRRDEGRSTFQVAYEWYDRARKVSHRYDMPHPHFSAAVLNSLACHAVSSYARELTQQMYDAFADAARLNDEGEAEGAKLRFDDGRGFLAKAIDTWSWGEREWKSQVLEFPSPSLPHEKFVTEANQMHEQLSRLSGGVSLERLPELLQEIERPTLR